MSELEQLTSCPNCGSTHIVTFEGHDACVTCRKAWERIPAGESFKRDGELMPFDKPCDNCAFRGGSKERQDKDYWKNLDMMLSGFEGRFYCHKGVPFELALEHSFEYPKRETQAMGKTVQIYDIEKMRLCRGYLNAHVKPMTKKASNAG